VGGQKEGRGESDAKSEKRVTCRQSGHWTLLPCPYPPTADTWGNPTLPFTKYHLSMQFVCFITLLPSFLHILLHFLIYSLVQFP
jgi:hypothetical protein